MHRIAVWTVTGSLALLSGLTGAFAASPDAPTLSPTEVAAAYLDAMEAPDLDAAGALFATESSIFETGGVEGDWTHYREHHLAPEVDSIKSFTISRGKPEEERSRDGSMAFVAWPIEYHIALADEREIDSRGTVTFVLLEEEGDLRIRHVHWSSRRKPADGS